MFLDHLILVNNSLGIPLRIEGFLVILEVSLVCCNRIKFPQFAHWDNLFLERYKIDHWISKHITPLWVVITFDYIDSVSKFEHILTPLFVHKETLNLEYVNKASGVTLILGNLLKQQDTACCKNNLQQRRNGSFCKNLTKRIDIDFYHIIKILI